ncbi:thioredoxin family protein [Hugenholtzia roseola]|uniref:thioredoxin family protein n=1 Tax=Hugenholtzia roseola TaxID=1002 RepID=UPI0003F75F83|nr:DUF255 domain-containing protein [Hugenholtzia roseola]
MRKVNFISKKAHPLAIICALLFFFGVGSAAISPTEKKQELLNEPIKWYSFQEAMEMQKKAPRKIFVDVYTDWCGWCKKMDKNTFQNPIIAKQLNQDYYAVKFNAETEREPITVGGHTFKYVEQNGRGYHELAVALLSGKMSYPTVAFLDEEMRLIQAVPGYQEPKPFDQMLNFFTQDAYKTTPWEQFVEGYQSPFEDKK